MAVIVSCSSSAPQLASVKFTFILRFQSTFAPRKLIGHIMIATGFSHERSYVTYEDNLSDLPSRYLTLIK